MDQVWSYVVTAIGILGFYLAGRKIWWAWYVNIFNQILWTMYAVVTQQWGFLLGAVFYTAVFTKNAVGWTRERHKQVNPE
jgi:hypothetical protein